MCYSPDMCKHVTFKNFFLEDNIQHCDLTNIHQHCGELHQG